MFVYSENLTVRQNLSTLHFFAVSGKNSGVAGRNFPHPQLGFNCSSKQNVCAVMPEHALKMIGKLRKYNDLSEDIKSVKARGIFF